MKLFVDDIRMCPEGWDLARTNSDAIRMLSTGYVEEISLDHDIMSCNMIGQPVGETFAAIVYYIMLMEKKPTVYFHSGNFAATQTLAEIAGIKYVRTDSVYDYNIIFPGGDE